jgi:hypothetical protein
LSDDGRLGRVIRRKFIRDSGFALLLFFLLPFFGEFFLAFLEGVVGFGHGVSFIWFELYSTAAAAISYQKRKTKCTDDAGLAVKSPVTFSPKRPGG